MSNPAHERQLAIAKRIEWSEAMEAAGKRDAMGYPFTSWKVAVYQADGKAARDARGHQIFVTQTEWKAQHQPHAVPTGQTLSLF